MGAIEIIVFKTNSGKILIETKSFKGIGEEQSKSYRLSGDSNMSFGVDYCLKHFNTHTIYCKSKNLLLKVGDNIISDDGKKLKVYGLIVNRDFSNAWIATDIDFMCGISLDYYLQDTYEVCSNPPSFNVIKWGNKIYNKNNCNYYCNYDKAMEVFMELKKQ